MEKRWKKQTNKSPFFISLPTFWFLFGDGMSMHSTDWPHVGHSPVLRLLNTGLTSVPHHAGFKRDFLSLQNGLKEMLRLHSMLLLFTVIQDFVISHFSHSQEKVRVYEGDTHLSLLLLSPGRPETPIAISRRQCKLCCRSVSKWCGHTSKT